MFKDDDGSTVKASHQEKFPALYFSPIPEESVSTFDLVLVALALSLVLFMLFFFLYQGINALCKCALRCNDTDNSRENVPLQVVITTDSIRSSAIN